MSEMKAHGSVVVIGDVVGSRTSTDRPALHADLSRALEEVNATWGTDLRITVGDEYQGTVASVGAATAITLALRLALLPDHDLRHGIGHGTTTVLDEGGRIEDGPGWWAARAAIDGVKERARRPATGTARTAYASADPGEATGALDAALLARDELVARLDERSLSVLRGLMAGRTQREIAAEEGVSPSAISQRFRRDGIGVVVTMSEWLEVRP